TGTGCGDMRLLVPDSVFAGMSPNKFVYLYSSFGPGFGVAANGGFEQWSVRPVQAAPPAPPAATGSLAGFVYQDLNGNGVYDTGEGIAGLTITLSAVDANGNNLYPDGDLTVTTGDDGAWSV